MADSAACSHPGAAGPCMPRVSDGRCIWCERPLSTAGDRLRELVPEKLRELYVSDPVVHACFATAAYGELSRESALVQCVTALCESLAVARAQLSKIAREGVPDIVIQSPEGATRLRSDLRVARDPPLPHQRAALGALGSEHGARYRAARIAGEKPPKPDYRATDCDCDYCYAFSAAGGV